MALPNKKRGYQGHIYFNANNDEPPTWTEITAAMDIKIGDSWNTFEASDRSTPVKQFLPSQQEWTLEFSFIWDQSNTELVALRDLYRSGDSVNLWAADGPSDVVGTSGPDVD